MQDVIIIGGGPSGSTCGSMLAMHGRNVTILEKEKLPREHVGESLLPFCYHTFEKLGVLDAMKQLFVRKPTVRFVTIDGSRYTNWCFNHVIKDESFLSFQVDRKVFDTVLLANSRRLGVDVHEQTKVTDVAFDTDRDCVTVSAIGPDGAPEVHEGRFLVDCSGRGSFMAIKNGWRNANKSFDRTAIWTHMDGVTLKGGLEEGSSLIIYLGGNKRGWIWVFPLGPNRITAGVVVDNAYLREQKQALTEAGSKDWRHDLFMQELGESPFVSSLIEGGTFVMPVITEGDYSYNSSTKYGPRFALVGDAGRFIDPIFSSGVFLCTKSAWLVADALHEMLDNKSLDDNAPLLKAYEPINGAYNFVFRLIESFYNPHAISWAAARPFFQEHQETADAMAAGHFILSGDFFENHKKYNEFLDLLQSPRYFEMYRQQVIYKQEYNVASCGLTPEQMAILFPDAPKTLAELPAFIKRVGLAPAGT